jgi:hypothetical protein
MNPLCHLEVENGLPLVERVAPPLPGASAMRTAELAWWHALVRGTNLADIRAGPRRIGSDLPGTRRPGEPGGSRLVCSSVVQDRQVEFLEAFGVGYHVDLGNLAACDREIEDEEQPTLPCHDESYGSVHESRSCRLCTS